MSVDDFPFWTSIFAPMAYFFKTKINHSNRITAIETWKESTDERLQKLDKLDDVCNDISYIKGLLDEHLKE